MPRLGRSRPASSYKLVRPVGAFAPTPVAQSDAAGAVEALSVAVAAPMADAGGAADALAVIVAMPDAAGAVDHLTVAAAAPSADVAGAVESMAVAAAAPSADVAGAVERMGIGIAQPDVAGAADSLSVAAAVPSADVAGAVEAMSFPVPIQAPEHDVAAAVESMSVVAGGPSTFIGAMPGGGGQYALPPGYQGGPSGAGSIPPSALGNSWEIFVRSGADYTTLLAQIPATMLLSFQFARLLDDIGSGTVVLSQDDPWWRNVTLPGGLPTETLLDDECLWQVWKDGVCRFEFFGETVTEQLVDPSEQRIVTITGPGTIAALKWAMVAPQGFPNIVLKLDGILDTFDEVDITGTPVIDTNIWTTISPSGSVYITPIATLFNYPEGAGYALSSLYPSGSMTLAATAGTTFLGASPYDATDTLISAQITPIGVSSTSTDSTTPAAYGTGLNGSELTQFYIQSNFNSGEYALFGLTGSAFYAQIGNGSGQVTTKILPAYDPTNHANWMITEQAGTGGGAGTFYFWTSPDGQQWTLQWSVVHGWDARNVTFFVTAAYSVAGQKVQLTNLNSMVTTPSYQGAIYLGSSMMGIWFDQFTKAQARGTISFVTSQASGTADSYGRAWTDTQNVQATNGTDLYSFLQSATAVVNADYVMDPGFQLRVGMPASGQVALGVDRSSYLVLRDGHDVMARQRIRARDQIVNLLGAENSDGHEISASSPTFIAEWRQREGWYQTAAQVDPTSMAFAAGAALAQNETEVLSWTFTLVPNILGKTVFDNFDVGDWLGLERPDFSGIDDVRLIGIAVSVDNTGAETHELTFQSYIQWLAEQLTYLAKKLGGQFINAQGTTPVAPSKYGTGQVPTYFTPAATLARLADVAPNSVGSAQSNAPLVYNPATGQYQAAGSTDPATGQTIPVTVQTAAGSATVTDTTVVVNTGSGSTTIGMQGDGTVTSVDSGGAAPAIPDLPTVAGIVQGILVSWDGLLTTALPLSNFQAVNVYVGTSSGFTPSTANQVGTFTQAGSLTVSGLTTGTTYYAKLIAVSTAGIASAATAAASAVAAGLPTAALTGQLPASLLGNSAGSWALNPNPFFNGGDLTGWTVSNGTLTATSSVPAGAPGSPPWCAQVTSTSSGCLIAGSTAPFPVTPGQPYAMTAWVYNPSGTAVNVAIGFNWTGGTVTVSCPATSWTPLTTVQTCPALVTSAYQVLGPTASGKTINVTAAVAAGQVSGQLLAANTVTANQIAANTITAAQIAAATITAAQIAANTITASQIAASTITGAKIAAATITATNIAAATITATQIAASTITGTQIAASISLTSPSITGGTITGGSIIADGSSGEVLVYSGSPAFGNLLVAISGAAGSDGSGNPYSTGVTLAGLGSAPSAISGSAILYGTSDGSLQTVDGLDGNVYQTQHLTQVLGSSTGINTSTPQTLLSASIGPRNYRVYGWFLITATSNVAVAVTIAGPGGSGGQFSFEIARASSFYYLANFGLNSTFAGPALTSGNVYVMRIDGLLTNSSSGTLALQMSCSTTPNSFTVDQPSFMDVLPV